MPDDIVAGKSSDFNRAIEHLRTELSSLRTGRASSAMVENVSVEAYPPMTEESRLKMKKLLGERLEHGRIAIRQIREDIRGQIKAQDIPEDDKYRLLEDLDRVAAQFNDRIREIGEEKEKEIMTI